MTQITDEEWQKMSPEERQEFQIKNCIFCKIINGEIPSKKIYDDSDFVGILDINPATKGHVVILPKKHVQIMPQLGTELNGKLGIVTKNISQKIIKSLGVKGTSVFIANGAVAGQNAPHFMLHIIPRKENDGLNLNPELKKVNEENVTSLRQKFISTLGLPEPGKEEQGPIKEKTAEKPDEKNVKKEPETKQEKKPDKKLLDKIKGMFD